MIILGLKRKLCDILDILKLTFQIISDFLLKVYIINTY